MLDKIKNKIMYGLGLSFSFIFRLLRFDKYIMHYLHDDIDKLLLLHRQEGYFIETGWIQSVEQQLPVDVNGNPIPWLTYSFIEFISRRIQSHHTVFEYGCGNSTLYFSQRVKMITAAENDLAWYEKFNKMIPSNVNLLYREQVYDGEYCKLAMRTGKKYDIIIVDGRNRVNCIKNIFPALKDDGVIILDDSERNEYQEGIKFLTRKKFKSIDFWGISPGLFYNKCTTVFYRERNSLGI
jgi:hypothetical protein